MKRILLSLLVGGFLVVGLQLKDADAGRIITSKRYFSKRGSSKGALIASWYRQQQRDFWEDKKKKRWRIYFAVMFGRRVNDLEVTVELYDITKQKRFLESFSLWLRGRGESHVTSDMKLPRDDDGKFRANSKILMRVVDGNKNVLAATWFRIRGIKKKYSGKVTFTVEETSGKKKGDLSSGSRGLKKKAPEPKPSPMGNADCPPKGAARLMIWGCGSFL